MLTKVLGVKSAAALTAARIEALVAEHQEEHQYLDFKVETPKDEPSRQRVAVVVAAMANAGGGLLVFGVGDHADRADALRPFQLAGEDERLRNTLRVKIEPLPTFRVHPVPSPVQGEGYLIVEILPSARRPFAVSDGPRWLFPSRHGKETRYLREPEIDHMYRARFARLITIDRQLRELREPLTGSLLPKGYILGVPMETHERLFRPDESTLQTFRRLAWPADALGSPHGKPCPTPVRTVFKGLEWQDGGDQLTFHDDGRFAATIHPLVSHQGGVTDITLTAAFIGRLVGIGRIAQQIGLSGDFQVHMGIVADTQHTAAIVGSFAVVVRGQSLDHRIETAQELDVSDLLASPALIYWAKPLLDDLFSGFALPECPFLNTDGTLRAAPFDGNDLIRAQRWAAATGITFAG